MDVKRREFLLKLGFFPVTDDFWAGADMPWATGKYTWAFRQPNARQWFMPWSEERLTTMENDALKINVERMIFRND